jgi:hypothetical protein
VDNKDHNDNKYETNRNKNSVDNDADADALKLREIVLKSILIKKAKDQKIDK